MSPFISDKSPTKCDAQLPQNNYQTRSSTSHESDKSDLLIPAIQGRGQ
ncbi:DUF6783 domain-containing protein [Robinsoniella peoriensis]